MVWDNNVGVILKEKQPDGTDKPVTDFSKQRNEVKKKKESNILRMLGSERSH